MEAGRIPVGLRVARVKKALIFLRAIIPHLAANQETGVSGARTEAYHAVVAARPSSKFTIGE